MKTLFQILAICLLFICARSKAQDQPTSIAILPFTSASSADSSLTRIVQETVAGCFANKPSRFYLLDRSKLGKFKREIEETKGNSFVFSPKMIEQGRLIGAEYIITGVVSPIDIETATTSNIDPLNPKKSTGTSNVYNGTIRLQLQIDKVETGAVFLSKSIATTSKNFASMDKTGIVSNALCRLGNDVQTRVRQMFTPPITILKITKENGGYPDQLLITGGKEIFDNGSSAPSCPGDDEIRTDLTLDNATSVLKGLWGSNKTKVFLTVFTTDQYTVNGKPYNQESTIGELEVKEIQGDVTVCKVSKGKKEIKSLLDSKKAYAIKVKSI